MFDAWIYTKGYREYCQRIGVTDKHKTFVETSVIYGKKNENKTSQHVRRNIEYKCMCM